MQFEMIVEFDWNELVLPRHFKWYSILCTVVASKIYDSLHGCHPIDNPVRFFLATTGRGLVWRDVEMRNNASRDL